MAYIYMGPFISSSSCLKALHILILRRHGTRDEILGFEVRRSCLWWEFVLRDSRDIGCPSIPVARQLRVWTTRCGLEPACAQWVMAPPIYEG